MTDNKSEYSVFLIKPDGVQLWFKEEELLMKGG